MKPSSSARMKRLAVLAQRLAPILAQRMDRHGEEPSFIGLLPYALFLPQSLAASGPLSEII